MKRQLYIVDGEFRSYEQGSEPKQPSFIEYPAGTMPPLMLTKHVTTAEQNAYEFGRQEKAEEILEALVREFSRGWPTAKEIEDRLREKPWWRSAYSFSCCNGGYGFFRLQIWCMTSWREIEMQSTRKHLTLKIPPKHYLTVLHDTARLLDDIASLHPCPEYVHGYAADLRRATKEIRKFLKGIGGQLTWEINKGIPKEQAAHNAAASHCPISIRSWNLPACKSAWISAAHSFHSGRSCPNLSSTSPLYIWAAMMMEADLNRTGDENFGGRLICQMQQDISF
jgi:hypothetical protein